MTNFKEKNWQSFQVDDIFDVCTGARLPKNELLNGKIPRISASEIDNGIIGTFSKTNHNNYRELSNFISVSFLGGVFYHPYTASLDMKIHALKLNNADFNRYSGEFLVFVLRRMASVFSYGDQLSSTDLPRQKILLPVDSSNNPDWQFMEDYMKTHEQNLISRYRDYLAKHKKLIDQEGGA